MTTRVEDAVSRHDRRYNCAQAVACTYCSLFDVDERFMFKLMEGFGSGMGGRRGTCGALSGACAIAGLASSTGHIEAPESKARTYAMSKTILQRFQDENGSTTCEDLKGVKDGHPLCSCTKCVHDAAVLVEDVILAARSDDK